MKAPAAALAAAIALSCIPLAGVGFAEPAAPFVTPQRDVDVTYRVPLPGLAPAGANRVATQRMRWSAALWRQRLEPPGLPCAITDYRSGTLLLVDPARHAALLLAAPANRVQPPGARGTASYARLGEQRVAGVGCTEWRTTDASGAPSLVCFTADGVMLRARQGGRTLIEAARVRYAPQDPSLFEAPPGTRIRRARSP